MTAKRILAQMPDDVHASAWCNSRAWYLRPTHWLWTGLFYLIAFAIHFAWWVPAYWLLFASLPIDAITDAIPRMRNFIGWSYLAWAILAIGFHWYDLQCHVPRKDKSYRNIGDDLLPREMIRHLSYHVLGYAALLFLACVMKSHGSSSFFDHLWTALGMVAVGSALLYYSFHPLQYGLHVPSESEVLAAVYQREHQRLIPPSTASDYATPVEKRPASLVFDDIFGMTALKEKLLAPARRVLSHPGSSEPVPNGILLHGEPGNGKTIFAEALAGELGIPFVELTYGAVSSKWVGEMPKVLANCFTYARHNAPCLLFIDEVDSFIRSRDEYSNNPEDQKITNTLLTEIVSLRKHKVVLVAATNFLAKLDPAAIREGRFDYKVEVSAPDEAARLGLLTRGVQKYGPHLKLDQGAMLSIARRWKGFSASRLTAVVKALPEHAQHHALPEVGYEDWIDVLRSIQSKTGRVPENAKSLADLVLEPITREALTMICSRLKDVHRIEMMGGSLPTGILFHGAAGTGKTAAARALAKECGWSFLSVAGPELLGDREKLPRLFAEAKDLRPALIFIDEADDVLRRRDLSNTADITNRLLVLMDGVDDRVQDVIFVAATNYPDQVDPALLRAGRFTEKVEFMAPASHQVPGFIDAWLEGRSLALAPGIDSKAVARLVEGETIANIEGILQYALNRAIEFHTGSSPLMLSNDDLNAAVRVVSAGS